MTNGLLNCFVNEITWKLIILLLKKKFIDKNWITFIFRQTMTIWWNKSMREWKARRHQWWSMNHFEIYCRSCGVEGGTRQHNNSLSNRDIYFRIVVEFILVSMEKKLSLNILVVHESWSLYWNPCTICPTIFYEFCHDVSHNFFDESFYGKILFHSLLSICIVVMIEHIGGLTNSFKNCYF